MIKLCRLMLLVSIFAAGCAGAKQEAEADAAAKAKAEADAKEAARPKQATAILHPTQDSVVTGIVSFQREGETIHVNAEFQGLIPGKYVFNLHEVGDCSDPQAASAGAKLNSGDFGVVEASEVGAAKLEFVGESLTLEGDNTVLNHSVVIYAVAGDSGSEAESKEPARLACGVIKLN